MSWCVKYGLEQTFGLPSGRGPREMPRSPQGLLRSGDESVVVSAKNRARHVVGNNVRGKLLVP